MRQAEGLTAYATFMTPVASTAKAQKSFGLDGGRDRTRTCDLLRVKDVKMGKYLSFQGGFTALDA